MIDYISMQLANIQSSSLPYRVRTVSGQQCSEGLVGDCFTMSNTYLLVGQIHLLEASERETSERWLPEVG